MFPFLSRKAVKVRQRRAHKCKEPGWLDLNEYNWISKIFKSLHSVDKISQYQWKKAGEFVDSFQMDSHSQFSTDGICFVL